MKKKTASSANPLKEVVRKSKTEKYLLRLFVTGITPQSSRAIANLKKICEEHLKGRYDLEVIDLYQQPELAKEEQIIAAPTLIKKLPLPLRRIIGDMSSADKLLIGLDLKEIK
jgi:circadian clock protein KaiB